MAANVIEAYKRVNLGLDGCGRHIILDNATHQAFQDAEAALGHNLVIVQGSYMASQGGGATQSAGTHDGGGVLDISVHGYTVDQITNIVRVLREKGFAAWYRTPAEGFEYHIHAVQIGNRMLSYGASVQVQEYRNGLNGLANHGKDDGPLVRPIMAHVYRPSKPTIYYPNVRHEALTKDKSPIYGVRVVQKTLNDVYKAGIVEDGIYGPETNKAYRVHQKAVKTPVGLRHGIPRVDDLTKLAARKFFITGTK